MIKIYTHVEDLFTIRQEWANLAEKAHSPLLDFDWFMSCLDTIDKDKRIYVVTVQKEKQITALAPLCLTNRSRIPVLELIGSSTLFEPSGFLFESQDTLNVLLKAIKKQKYPVALYRVPTDYIDSLKSFQNATLTFSKLTAFSNYIDTASGWDQFLSNLSANRRYDFKRKRNRLNKQGNTKLKIFNPSLDTLMHYLDIAFQIENKSWKRRTKSSLLENSSLQEFFRNYAIKCCKNNSLRMCFIYVDDQAIAMHIAVVAYNSFWVLKLGYDEAWAKCSPGILLAMDTIEYSFKQQISRYEFLGSEEKWQFSWSVEQHQYCTILLFPFSLLGMTALTMALPRIIISKLKQFISH